MKPILLYDPDIGNGKKSFIRELKAVLNEAQRMTMNIMDNKVMQVTKVELRDIDSKIAVRGLGKS